MSTGRARSYNNDDADCSQFVDPAILKILPDAAVFTDRDPAGRVALRERRRNDHLAGSPTDDFAGVKGQYR